MVKYVKIYNLFEGFLKSLNMDQLNTYDKKLINLIRNNFDDIANVGTFQGKRAELLSQLIKNKGKIVKDTINIKVQDISEKAFLIKKIKQMEIEHFRGFGKKETFSFDKGYTLIYGPNGSGKSSFCDALEFAMLGYINEAIAKRIDVDKYIVNAITKKRNNPALKAIDMEGEEIDLQQNSEMYEFCFIEKNRIANFARISANTPKDQQSLLSALFGLEEFNRFAMHFTDNFEKYIDVEGEKQKELDQKKQGISDAEKNIKETEDEIDKLAKEKKDFVSKFSDKGTFSEVDTYINGELKSDNDSIDDAEDNGCDKKKEKLGRMADIDNILSQPLLVKYYIKKYEDLKGESNAIERQIEEYISSKQDIEKESDKVSYKKLYEAIIDLQNVSKDRCPACHTPIENTSINPYDNARKEIDRLKYIVELEQKLNSARASIFKGVNAFVEGIKKIEETSNRVGRALGIDVQVIITADPENDKSYIGEVKSFLRQIEKRERGINYINKEGCQKNSKIDNIEKVRESLGVEKRKLLEATKVITNIKTRQNVYDERIKKTYQKIEKFKEENKVLIKEVEAEALQIAENIKYLKAYKTVVQKLKTYNEQLPLKLVEDLNELTREFYNVMNTNDKEFELLSSVEMPVSSDSGIKIVFNDKEGETFDALHILSEGHIRCLGLAILLAKNVADNKGVVIFDDAVNAIDDEHREGVRELLFKNDKIKDKQIILTSHAEEFIKDLDNQFKGKEYAELVQRITFLRPLDERSIMVDKGETTFNYLKNAELALDVGNKRDCLMNCRRALENITASLWIKLGKIYNIGVTVKMRHPKQAPDLMTVVQGLRSFLEKDSFVQKDDYKDIVSKFEYLEGLETAYHNVWRYLNEGTHDESDRKEFDGALVEKVKNNLKELSDLVK